MAKYQDLINVPVKENDEPIIVIDPGIIPNAYSPVLSDMQELLGSQLYVRKSVFKKLQNVQINLKKRYPSYTLFVTYGYRSTEVQTRYFLKQLQIASQTFFADPVALYEEVHRQVAVPTVAGHPTGGAIDIVIKNTETGKLIDFGAEQYDFSSKDCYVFTQSIGRMAIKNRLLLRALMIGQGFAPFDGEWWHFSYGDREWAYYYNKPTALYEQKLSSSVKNMYNKEGV